MDPITGVPPEPAHSDMILRIGIVVVVVAFVAAGGWYGYRYYQSQQLQPLPALAEGTAALNNGDYVAAQAQFEAGMSQARTNEEKGYFETLLAATYMATDFKKGADAYLSVINNTTYSDRTRGLATTYLMKTLKSSQNLEGGKYVFSQVPFTGFLNTEYFTAPPFIPSKIIPGVDFSPYALSDAIARGDEYAVSLYPNFLSHLSLAKFYAGYYTRYVQEKQTEVYPLIAKYFTLGDQELLAAANDPAWNSGLVAYGYSLQSLAAETIYDAQATGIYQDKNAKVGEQDVDTYFDQADAYMNEHRDQPVIRGLLALNGMYHAGFLLTMKDGRVRYAEKLVNIAKEINDLVVQSPSSLSSFTQAVKGSDEVSAGKRGVLITLTDLYPALKATLEGASILSSADFK